MFNPLILSLSIAMLATAPVIVKFSSLAPVIILVWRLILVCLMLSPLLFKKRVRLLKKEMIHILFASFLMFLHFMSWFSGVKLLSVGLTTIIYATNPIFTAMIGFFFIKEKFNFKFIFAFILSILGIVIAASDKVNFSESKLEGIIYIILAAIFYSAYIVYSKHNRKNIDNAVYSFYLNLFTCVIGLILIIFLYIFSSFQIESLLVKDLHEIFYLFLLALFPSLLGHSLMTYTVKHYNLNFISCFKLASPLIASFLAYFFFNEVITKNLIIGFSFVAIGILFALPWNKKQRL